MRAAVTHNAETSSGGRSKTTPSETAALDDCDVDFGTRIKGYEQQLIVAALRDADGNKTEADRRLRMPLRTLVHKVKTYGIKRSAFTSED